MPQIKFRGIEKKTLKKISGKIVEELKDMVEVPADWFTVEYQPTEFFTDGQEDVASVLIQVHWFGRSLEIQDKVAEILTDIVKLEGYKEVEISFHLFDKRSYYENAKHF